MALQKLRDPATIWDVWAQYVDILGAQEVADAVGLSRSVVYKATDPESGYVREAADDFRRLDRACLNVCGRAPYLAFHRQQTGVDEFSPQPLEAAALSLSEETGNMAKLVRSARDPASPAGQNITPNESLLIRRQAMREAVDGVDKAADAESKVRDIRDRIKQAGFDADGERRA